MTELKALLEYFGLHPLAILIIVVFAGAGVFFTKFALQRHADKQKKLDETLHAYRGLQMDALLKAYRKLYEDVELKALTPIEFRRTLNEADALIMDPLTKFRAYLDQRVVDHIYDMHNIVAQFRCDPALTARVTPEAIDKLCGYKESFEQDIEVFKKLAA